MQVDPTVLVQITTRRVVLGKLMYEEGDTVLLMPDVAAGLVEMGAASLVVEE